MGNLAPARNLAQAGNVGELINEVFSRLPKNKEINVAFLGYTDLMMNSEEWAELGVVENKLENRHNFDRLTAIHGRPDVTVVPTLSSAVPSLVGKNCQITIFDFEKVEGNEVERDFNFPIDIKFEQKFDVIFDMGTCEHIFNLAQAFTNIHKMLKIGGFVYHGGPLCWPNHGFYGYNPTLFYDFYEDNGSEVIELFLKSHGSDQPVTIENVPKYDRFPMRAVLQDRPEWLVLEFTVNVLVHKNRHCKNITFPIQRKYRDMSKWM